MTDENAAVTLEDLARRALEGDREALDSLAHALQGDIYGLALRVLWNREDAENATQEILVRIVTGLSQFGFQSRLQTFAFNYVLDVKKSAIERLHLGFDRFAEGLESGLLGGEAAEVPGRRSCCRPSISSSGRPHRRRVEGMAGHPPGLRHTETRCPRTHGSGLHASGIRGMTVANSSEAHSWRRREA